MEEEGRRTSEGLNGPRRAKERRATAKGHMNQAQAYFQLILEKNACAHAFSFVSHTLSLSLSLSLSQTLAPSLLCVLPPLAPSSLFLSLRHAHSRDSPRSFARNPPRVPYAAPPPPSGTERIRTLTLATAATPFALVILTAPVAPAIATRRGRPGAP